MKGAHASQNSITSADTVPIYEVFVSTTVLPAKEIVCFKLFLKLTTENCDMTIDASDILETCRSAVALLWTRCRLQKLFQREFRNSNFMSITHLIYR